jgi:hypothetical protein
MLTSLSNCRTISLVLSSSSLSRARISSWGIPHKARTRINWATTNFKRCHSPKPTTTLNEWILELYKAIWSPLDWISLPSNLL